MKLLTSVFALLVVFGLAGVAMAKDKAAAGPKPVKGVVKEVAADAKSVTVTVGKGDAATDQKFDVDDATKVTIEGKDAKVADLKAGQKVSVTVDATIATKATAIEVPAPKPAKGG